LALDFGKIEFKHNCREADAVAHVLARLARDQEHHVWLDFVKKNVWLHDPPTSIIPLPIKDVTLVTNE
jgi:hypothetical protein